MFVVVCALLCLGACRTLPSAPVESTGPAGAYSRQSILVGDQAFLTSDAFYIRFRRGDQVIHGGGQWSNRIDLQDYPDTNPSGDMFILPLVTDRGPITRNNVLAANIMLEHGIRIFIYPGMSHVKAAVFDGWACLGSANWDRWSLQINKEMNIATSDEAAVAALNERLFEKDFAVSAEITEPLPVRWQDHLIERFGDYLF